MTVKNPGSESEKNQLPGLTAEIVQELNSGRMKVEQLNEVQLRQLVEDEDGPDEAPTAVHAAKPPNAAAVEAPAPPAPKVENPKPIEGADAVDGEAYRKKSDELNTVQQRLSAREAELATARALLEANKKAKEAAPAPKKTIDDDGYFESLEERLARLEEENKSLREGNERVLGVQVKSLADQQREEAVNATFLDIEAFQYRSKSLGMDLRTETPVRQIDAAVSRLEGTIGKENVVKMKRDPAFRAEMATKGIVLPPEWEKHDTIMQIHDFKKKGYPTFTSAFADFVPASGLLQRQVSEASLEVAKATADKLIQSSNETALLPADSGAGGASHTVLTEKWTTEKAAAWMKAHPTPKTREEMATQHEILDWLEKQSD